MDRLWVIDKRQNEHSNLCEKRLAILITMFFESVSSVAGEQVLFRACKINVVIFLLVVGKEKNFWAPQVIQQGQGFWDGC